MNEKFGQAMEMIGGALADSFESISGKDLPFALVVANEEGFHIVSNMEDDNLDTLLHKIVELRAEREVKKNG